MRVVLPSRQPSGAGVVSPSATRVAVAAEIWMSPSCSTPLSQTTTRSWVESSSGALPSWAIAGTARNADADSSPTVAMVIQAHRRRLGRTGWGETVVSVSREAIA